MAHFEYRGRRAGQSVTGRIEAPSSDGAALRLADLGVVPVSIKAAPAQAARIDAFFERLKRKKVDLDDLIVFARQMNTMSRAGLPILRSMKAIASTTHNPALEEALGEIGEALEAGRGLASALRQHPNIFSPLFVSAVQMGEETGRLEEAFDQLGTYLEIERDTRKRIKGAMRYPLTVIVAIVIAIGILDVYALPVFAEIFAGFGAELPLPTRILIASSNFTIAYWPYLIIGSALAVFGIVRFVRTDRGRMVWHRAQLRIPLTGSILSRAAMARFSRTFSLALRSGVPLLQGIRIAASIVDNDWLTARFLELQERIERGDSLTRTANASALFPPLVLQMIAVGEETGSLDELLHEAARFYEAEVDYELKRLAESIEPILIVAIGALVLLLALGVYLPMWDLASAARSG